MKVKKQLSVYLTLLLLTACGGGSGGGSDTDSSTTPATSEKTEFKLTLNSITTTDYNLSWASPTNAKSFKVCASSIDEITYDSAQVCNTLSAAQFSESITTETIIYSLSDVGSILSKTTINYFRVVAYDDSDEIVAVSTLVGAKLGETNVDTRRSDSRLSFSGTEAKNEDITFSYDYNGIDCVLKFRDGSDPIELDSCTGSVIHQFPKEWVYNVELVSSSETIRQIPIIVENVDDTWIGFVFGLNNYFEKNEDTSKFIKKGIVRLESELEKFWVDYRFIKKSKLSSVSGDDFMLEARVKNPVSEGGIACYDPTLRVVGEKGKSAWVTFMDTGVDCTKYAKIGAADSFYTGGNSTYASEVDLLSLGQDFSDWHVIKLEVKDGNVSAYYDDVKKYTAPYTGSVGNIYGVAQSFKGSGSLDWIQLTDKDGNVAYREDFTN